MMKMSSEWPHFLHNDQPGQRTMWYWSTLVTLYLLAKLAGLVWMKQLMPKAAESKSMARQAGLPMHSCLHWASVMAPRLAVPPRDRVFGISLKVSTHPEKNINMLISLETWWNGPKLDRNQPDAASFGPVPVQFFQIAVSLTARYMGHLGAHLEPTGPRWAPCWPHELCYLGCLSGYIIHEPISKNEDGGFSNPPPPPPPPPVHESFWVSNKISLKYVPWCLIDSHYHTTVWRPSSGDKSDAIWRHCATQN